MGIPRNPLQIERRLNFGNAHEKASRGGLERVLTEPDWTSIPGQVKDASELGYDVLLSAEIPMDPYLPLVLASQVPSSMQLATGIAVGLSRSPVSTAYTAWELQRMSGGRFTLGLGSQVKAHIVRRYSMPWSAPAKRMREYIEVVKACWNTFQTGAPLNYEGECYQVNLMPHGMALPPQQNPNIPIQLAAVGELMLGVAGEVCEGVRLHDFCSKKYVEQYALPKLREGFQRSNRPEEVWQNFQITGGGLIATAATKDELQGEIIDLRKRLAFYASTPAYRVQMEMEGFEEQAEQLTALSKAGKWGDMLDVFTEEMAYRYAAIGTHDEIVDSILDHFSPVTAIQFSMRIGTPEERGIQKELIQDLKLRSQKLSTNPN